MPKYIQLAQIRINSNNFVSEININFIIPKATHYVQQAYLGNFSSNSKLWKERGNVYRARIFCFDKKTKSLVNIGNTESEKKYGQKIANVAHYSYFYSLYMEEFMRNTLENAIPPIFKKIINIKSIRNLTDVEKISIIKYIILTWNRTLEAREYLRESFEKGIVAFSQFIVDKKLLEGLTVEVDEYYLRNIHENLILRLLDLNDKSNLIKHLIKYEFGIIKAKRPYFFLTSDNPVILNNLYFEKIIKRRGKKYLIEQHKVEYNLIKSKGADSYIKTTFSNKGRGLGVKGIEIYLPISSYLCIYLCNRQDGFRPLDIKKINKEVILQSNRYIFSEFNDLNFFQKIIKKNPIFYPVFLMIFVFEYI